MISEQIYGPMSVLTADALFNYGRALLENGVKNVDVFGEKKPGKEAGQEQAHGDEEDDEEVSGSEDDEEDEGN